VISILKKQRQEVKDYKMIVAGEREKGAEPSLWKDVFIDFHIYGNVDEDKAKRAVELSMNKYCSVSETMRRAGTILKWNIFVHR
jgi:putative redox protein